jgi:ribonuclease HI
MLPFSMFTEEKGNVKIHFMTHPGNIRNDTAGEDIVAYTDASTRPADGRSSYACYVSNCNLGYVYVYHSFEQYDIDDLEFQAIKSTCRMLKSYGINSVTIYTDSQVVKWAYDTSIGQIRLNYRPRWFPKEKQARFSSMFDEIFNSDLYAIPVIETVRSHEYDLVHDWDEIPTDNKGNYIADFLCNLPLGNYKVCMDVKK